MSTTHKTEEERKRLFTLLKYDRWMKDSYLRCMMRKYYKHGKTEVDNQIILDTQCYTAFERNGQAWIKVMGLERGKRIVLLLLTRTFGIGVKSRRQFKNRLGLLNQDSSCNISTESELPLDNFG